MTVTSLLRLSSFSIPQLAERKKVSVPKYDRTQVQAGILHIGVGNFHRAHMAAYMDDLMNDDFDSHREWGIAWALGFFHSTPKSEKNLRLRTGSKRSSSVTLIRSRLVSSVP
mmetsp:Transcript_35825/g.78469  ORF Transcript_35825/g.78469 Transcript_35825/m.78469 type:complete len:112 (+) Transcript_35825:313-648(+)